MGRLRIALAQINTVVGDLEGNVRRILEGIDSARHWGADVVAFPEMTIPGYPPEDLLLRSDFVQANRAALEAITPATRGLTAIVGFVDRQDDIFNAAAVLNDGRLAGTYRKSYLPNYGPFDENRYFGVGKEAPVFYLGDATLAVNICEDIWCPGDPTRRQVLLGNAEVVINITASPYTMGKGRSRERMVATRAVDNDCYVAMCNLVGGQDDLVFDGHSMVFDERGELLARGRQFEQDLVLADLDLGRVFSQRLHSPRWREEKRRLGDHATVPGYELSCPRRVLETRPELQPHHSGLLEPSPEVYQALLLATGDYVRKNGFRKVAIGLSGGVDTALTACVAADALGPENVIGVFMPSRHATDSSREDAEQLASNLGIELHVIPIEAACEAYGSMLAEAFRGRQPDGTEENLQARVRGNVLMALANKFGWLVLATGNKSELSVGDATLYGDMAGEFAVLKDVPKALVYRLAHWRNTQEGVIPGRTLTRSPSGELRAGEEDTDALPPYEELDPILQLYVEEDRSPQEIIARGFEPAIVRRVVSMVDRAEHKRRQAPPGPKISVRSLGRDRRLPLTHRFRGLS